MRHQRGFTLIELMITVTVMGILAAVAIPTYDEYIQRSHRSNARGALLEAAQWMERAATAQGRYPLSAPVNQIPMGLVRVDGGKYQLTISSLDGIAYQITATAQGAQMSDKCGNFTLNQAGTRNVTGTLPVKDCWDH